MSQGHFGNLCDTDNFGDPVVLYDSFEDRWFITDFAFKLDGSAATSIRRPSTSASPSRRPATRSTAAGTSTRSSDPGGLGDYPKFGVWPDGIYMSANMFGYAAGIVVHLGCHVWALNKQQMYAGAPSAQVVDFAGDTRDFTRHPRELTAPDRRAAGRARLSTSSRPSSS